MDINNEHLKDLENEAIFVMREVAAQFENKVLILRRQGFYSPCAPCQEGLLALKNTIQSFAYRYRA